MQPWRFRLVFVVACLAYIYLHQEAVVIPPTSVNAPVPNLLIVVLTQSRLASLQQLWRSLEDAMPSTLASRIAIHVDFSPDNRNLQSFAMSLSSRHGAVQVIAQNKTQGIRSTYLSLYRLLDPTEDFLLFLEDDVSISPYALLFADRMIRAHFAAPNHPADLCGFSLYNIQFNEVTDGRLRHAAATLRRGLYHFQQPQSWGAVYTASCWSSFSHYANALVAARKAPVCPRSRTNRWRSAKSWKKYLFR